MVALVPNLAVEQSMSFKSKDKLHFIDIKTLKGLLTQWMSCHNLIMETVKCPQDPSHPQNQKTVMQTLMHTLLAKITPFLCIPEWWKLHEG